MNTTPILRATNIVKKLGGKTILNDVSLDVHKGDVKVVIGPSGAGKSTFLQCLNYLLPPDSGDIWLEGKKVNARDTRELCALRQQVGMIFQDFNLFDHLTAEENVSIALRKVMGCNKAEARNRALTELSRVGLAKRAALYPAQLSGGQKQRVAIARALAMDPKVMLLDEPTSALDPELVGEVLSVIRDLADGGMTMIMATHQMDFARALATDILFMEQGKIIEQGAPDVLLAPGSGTRTSDFCGKLFDLRPANVADTLQMAAAPFVLIARESGTELKVNGCGAVFPHDADWLAEAVGNLIKNALEHAPGGHVAVRANATPLTVEISVTDDGEGISMDVLPHLFERFYSRSSAVKSGSVGLGLALAKEIVTQCGGTISVESAPGRGTAFNIVFLVNK